MIEIGGKPILWHIMRSYHHYGFRRFILCLGYMGEVIKNYFLNYRYLQSDFTVDLATQDIEIHKFKTLGELQPETAWKVSLIDTGKNSMTGARVKRIEPLIKEEHFALTYGDGLCDVNLKSLLDFHFDHGKVGTVTSVHPPSRFGELIIDENQHVSAFSEKPQTGTGSINGGFFFFKKEFFNYLESDDSCILERTPLEKLARNQELAAHQHPGFWQCMDTQRDRDLLESLYLENQAPWLVWN